MEPPKLRQIDPTHLLWGRRRLVNYGGSDYFRLTWHPAIRDAIIRATRDYGHNVAASRRTTGDDPSYARLEATLTRFAKTEAAIVTATGYAAPVIATQGLASDYTHLLIDRKAHACLQDAAQLSGLPVRKFSHSDAGSLEKIIRRLGPRSRVFALCDGMSAQSGTVSPLRDYLSVLPANATLLVDDAHGFFVLGAAGRGVVEHLGLTDPRLVITTTMSKALGVYGGIILCTDRQRRTIVTRSRAFAGGTPLSIAFVAGAEAGLRVLRRDGVRLRRTLQANTERFRAPVNLTGVAAGEHLGPMFSIVPQRSSDQKRISKRLLVAGIYPTWIRYGGGPAEAFFRFAISTAHAPRQLDMLRNVLLEFVRAFD